MSQSLDLFTPVVDEKLFHPNFRTMIMPTESPTRKVLADWANGFIDRDGKFVYEFQTTFNSCFWELYIHKVLRENGFSIDFSRSSPDFILTQPFSLSIEAVTANHALGDTPEWERDYSEEIDRDKIAEILRTATIRLANSLVSKYRQYKERYESLEHVRGRPFIVALAPFEQPFFWEQAVRAIHRVLYAYDETNYINHPERNEREILGHSYLYNIEKDNGAEIPLGIFSENMAPEISAIIFSNTATFSKLRALSKDEDSRPFLISFSRYNHNGLYPIEKVVEKEEYHETLVDGLGIYLNPYAKYPLPDEFVSLFPSITEFDPYEKCVIAESEDGALFKRIIITFSVRDKQCEVKSD